MLQGHIIESTLGAYEPKNVVVRDAQLVVDRVLNHTPNPFFAGE